MFPRNGLERESGEERMVHVEQGCINSDKDMIYL